VRGKRGQEGEGRENERIKKLEIKESNVKKKCWIAQMEIE
jgi:hypothetical protein